jgi:L-histidine N-alpha-methyltransferase
MNDPAESIAVNSQIRVDNYLPRVGNESVANEILDGLRTGKKRISSKYFYDATGSKLFEAITRLPEYYPTRTERPLIKAAAERIAQDVDLSDIVELGSGDCSKISILLGRIQPSAARTLRYIPVDVSQTAIEGSAEMLVAGLPHLAIHGIVADFTIQLDRIPNGNKRLFCFFGSTIGNFSKGQIKRFFSHLCATMHSGDRLLLGLDRVKEKQILENAYNDREGITAAFNRNILNVVNDLAETDFYPQAFNHIAFYNDADQRIEMHLEARRDVIVTSPHLDDPLIVEQGERIHTENSHKFTDAAIAALAVDHGLAIEAVYTDRNQWFSLVQYIKP